MLNDVTIEVKHVREQGIVYVKPYGYRGPTASQMKDGAAEWPCDVWRVTFGYEGRTYTTEYRTGIGHRRRAAGAKDFFSDYTSAKKSVTARDVLVCLFADAQSGLETFEDFCSNSGLDTDSRKALDTYLTCQKIHTELRKLFGADYAAIESEVHE